MKGKTCGCRLELDAMDCPQCCAERDAHPVWQLIQRVERGEVSARLRKGTTTYNYIIDTSDGWAVEVFPDGAGEPYDDWDYIESATAPDGTKYVTDGRGSEHEMPMLVWFYRPDSEAIERKWGRT